MNAGILGQFGRSIWDERGILVFSENQIYESLRSWNIMVTPQHTDAHPCTLAAAPRKEPGHLWTSVDNS